AWVWRRRPTGWVVVDGDTGWRDLTSLWDQVAAESGFTWTTIGGFGPPSVRMTGSTLSWDVGVRLAPLAGQTWRQDVDLRQAFGHGTMWTRALTTNVQVPASQTGSSGVIHWAPYAFVRAWSAGDLRWVVTTSRFTPAGGAWPATLPGTPT
ncbi:MAG: hypothetical protein SO046_10275, partial [Actinomyces urogenitalis]|uniref:hypothetical protein n=1 Tax=Actinomyces urogenitalis TaxID=103621 RepID=UPI002A82A1BF